MTYWNRSHVALLNPTQIQELGDIAGKRLIHIAFDEYKTMSQYPPDVRKWLDDGADVNEWKTPRFARDVAALRRGESVIQERATATCDLVLDDRLPVDELAKQLVAAVENARSDRMA